MNQAPSYKLDAPLRVPVSKSKFFSLNLNQYRNAHYFTLNNAKKEFKSQMEKQITALPSLVQVWIVYELYLPSKRKADTSNICSIVDKFFCDALVELGKLPEDNYEHVIECLYRFGGVDTKNPRCEITIYT